VEWGKGTGAPSGTNYGVWECHRAPAGFKNVDVQPVGSGASLREMIRNIDNYFAIG